MITLFLSVFQRWDQRAEEILAGNGLEVEEKIRRQKQNSIPWWRGPLVCVLERWTLQSHPQMVLELPPPGELTLSLRLEESPARAWSWWKDPNAFPNPILQIEQDEIALSANFIIPAMFKRKHLSLLIIIIQPREEHTLFWVQHLFTH